MKATLGFLVFFLIAINANIIYGGYINGNINQVQHVKIFKQQLEANDEILPEIETPNIEDNILVGNEIEDNKRMPGLTCSIPLPKPYNNSSNNYEETFILNLMSEGEQLSGDILNLLELQDQAKRDEDYLYAEVDHMVQDIEERKVHIQCLKCAVDEALRVTTVVKDFYCNVKNCGLTAAAESVQIVIDVKDATVQIIFEGFGCLKLYKQCQAIKNPTKQKICMAKFTAKFSVYIVKACRSVRTLLGIKKRTLAIVPDAMACTSRSAKQVVSDLKDIRTKIDDCLGNNNNNNNGIVSSNIKFY